MSQPLQHSLDNFFKSTENELRIVSGGSGFFSIQDKKLIQNAIATATSQYQKGFISSYVQEKDKEVLIIKRK